MHPEDSEDGCCCSTESESPVLFGNTQGLSGKCIGSGPSAGALQAVGLLFLPFERRSERAHWGIDEQAYGKQILFDAVQQLCMVFVCKGHHAFCAKPMIIL